MATGRAALSARQGRAFQSPGPALPHRSRRCAAGRSAGAHGAANALLVSMGLPPLEVGVVTRHSREAKAVNEGMEERAWRIKGKFWRRWRGKLEPKQCRRNDVFRHSNWAAENKAALPEKSVQINSEGGIAIPKKLLFSGRGFVSHSSAYPAADQGKQNE